MSSAPQDASNDESARYKRAIRAAEELFKKVGFRAVTMELVAREADVAKGTLYSYFKNKDELFLAVCARLARIEQRAVEQALAKPDAPLDSRLADAIIAKHRTIFTLVRGSAHAAELFSYTHNMAGDIFGAMDAAILKTLQETIAQDPVLAAQAQRLARALYFGSAELAGRSETLADMEAELTSFAATHLAGVRALARTNASEPLPLIKIPP
ncbi:MAG TPA: helix-turn-helix domain-containing protein [Steroidobacteraceae bacterium]|nr:helix-turn-helix domain-containing protein [Steroidobacteraceae bacterium]